MSRLICTALISVLALAASAAGNSANEESPSVRVVPLKGSLYMLQGRGGNVVASAGEEGVLVIDSDYAELASAHQSAIDQLAGTKDTRPQFLLNTHWHSDHTGGNSYWGKQGALIVAHRNVRARMSTRQDMKALGRVVEPAAPIALPTVTYGDSLALNFNGLDIEVQHYSAGHTDGDSVVYFLQENVVHMGDLYFKDAFPFVDVGSGGNAVTYAENVSQVLARIDDNTVIVPGHGTVANKADLQRYHAMLNTSLETVRAGLEAGKSIDEVIAMGLGEEWADWGNGFINEANWIRSIAASY